MIKLDEMGHDEGDRLGPEPGKGAVVHESSGEADFDGLPGDVLPPKEWVKKKLGEESPAPPKKDIG